MTHNLPDSLFNVDLNETFGSNALERFKDRVGLKLIQGVWTAVRCPAGSENIRFISSKDGDMYILAAVVILANGIIVETDRIERKSPIVLQGAIVTSGNSLWVLSTNELMRVANFVELIP